jgi:hypothetical protein
VINLSQGQDDIRRSVRDLISKIQQIQAQQLVRKTAPLSMSISDATPSQAFSMGWTIKNMR